MNEDWNGKKWMNDANSLDGNDYKVPEDIDYDTFRRLIGKNKKYWKFWCMGFFDLYEKKGVKK